MIYLSFYYLVISAPLVHSLTIRAGRSVYQGSSCESGRQQGVTITRHNLCGSN